MRRILMSTVCFLFVTNSAFADVPKWSCDVTNTFGASVFAPQCYCNLTGYKSMYVFFDATTAKQICYPSGSGPASSFASTWDDLCASMCKKVVFESCATTTNQPTSTAKLSLTTGQLNTACTMTSATCKCPTTTAKMYAQFVVPTNYGIVGSGNAPTPAPKGGISALTDLGCANKSP